MIGTTYHPCEESEAWRKAGRSDIADTVKMCRQVGIIFIRDAEGYGHWVCDQHRRSFTADMQDLMRDDA